MENANETTLERRLKELFWQARSMVEHEDDLVDRRLKWVLTVSAFLFAAYVGTLVAYAKAVDTDSSSGRIILALIVARLIMCVAGVFSSIMGSISIEAAHIAIRAVARKYNRFIHKNSSEIRNSNIQVWKLIGDRGTHVPGLVSAIVQTYSLACLWTILIVAEFVFLIFIYPIPNNFLCDNHTKIIIAATVLASIAAVYVFGYHKSVEKIRESAYKNETSNSPPLTETQLGEITNLSESSFEVEISPLKDASEQDSGARPSSE